MIKAILFDLDGVILDSNPVIEAFWGGWAQKEGVEFNERVIKETIHGRTTWETIHTLFHQSDDARKQAIYDDGVAYDLRMKPALMPGVEDFLAALSARKLPFLLVTSSPHKRAWHFLKQHQLDRFFTDSITAEDVKKGKPDPEPYIKGAGKLGIQPEHCLVFEDSDSGITAALTAGMQVIALNNPVFQPDRVKWNIRNFEELLLLEKGLEFIGSEQEIKPRLALS